MVSWREFTVLQYIKSTVSTVEPPLIRSPVVQKNLAVLLGWPYYWGRLKFHELMAKMTNTLYSTFAFLEQLFSIINNWNVDIAYSNLKKK